MKDLLKKYLDLMVGAVAVAACMNIIVCLIRYSNNPFSIRTLTIAAIAIVPMVLVLLFIRERRSYNTEKIDDMMEKFPTHLDQELATSKEMYE